MSLLPLSNHSMDFPNSRLMAQESDPHKPAKKTSPGACYGALRYHFHSYRHAHEHVCTSLGSFFKGKAYWLY